MIEIKKMSREHASQIADLEAKCFSSPWSENSILSELDNELSLWLVALDGDVLAGYVGSQTVLGEADMMNIAVAQDHRRQGIAENLVTHLVDALCTEGCHSLSLEVRKSNIPAQKLYEKLGFTVVGCRPRYYQKPTEDALILRKEWEV